MTTFYSNMQDRDRVGTKTMPSEGNSTSDKCPVHAIELDGISNSNDGQICSRYTHFLAQRGLRMIKGIKGIMDRLHRLLETSAGQDCGLASLEYLLHALHHTLYVRKSLRGFICARMKSPNPIPSSTSQPWTARDRQHTPSALLSLSSMIQETRCTLRLFGLIGIIKKWADLAKSTNQSHTLKCISIAQMLSITAYQALENYAFLASKRALPARWITREQGVNRCFGWSVRALVFYLGLELVKLGREVQLSRNLRPVRLINDDKETSGDEAILLEEHLAWRKRLFSTSIWTILCVHWSFPPGVKMLDMSSGGLSFAADFFSFKELWLGTFK